MKGSSKGIKKTYTNETVETEELCVYGCGLIAQYRLKNGKLCCSRMSNSCPELIRRSAETRTGLKRTKEIREKFSKSHRGQISNKKGKTYEEIYGREQTLKIKEKMSISAKHTLKSLNKKYPLFCKVEQLREDPETGDIQCRCKNHKCNNSKENNGWFTPSYTQLYERMRNIERGAYFYCSEDCKQSCNLFGKSTNQIIKNFEIESGTYEGKKQYYTDEEYRTFRSEVLKRDNYKCIYCGEKAEHVHHTRPKKLEPLFVLDPDYAISCCIECHYKYGHKSGTECSTYKLAIKQC